MTQVPFDSTIENRPIRDIAYETLKHAIITGEIPAGSRIVETLYANKLHISRTPLREALRNLEQDGLVEYVLHRGVIVRAFTTDDIEEIFTIRNSMMMLILPSVIECVTDEDIRKMETTLKEMDVALKEENFAAVGVQNRRFHSTLEHVSNKLRILRVIDSQEEYITRFSALTIANTERRERSHDEHYQMVQLLKERDLAGLEKLMLHHLEESKTTCLATLRANKMP